MSHFHAVTTRITNQELLMASILEVGHQVRTNYGVRGYRGQAVQATVVAILDGEYDLGFQYTGTEFNAIADFSYGSCGGGSQGLEAELKKIIQVYAAKEAAYQASTNRNLAGANITVKVH